MYFDHFIIKYLLVSFNCLFSYFQARITSNIISSPFYYLLDIYIVIDIIYIFIFNLVDFYFLFVLFFFNLFYYGMQL